MHQKRAQSTIRVQNTRDGSRERGVISGPNNLKNKQSKSKTGLVSGITSNTKIRDPNHQMGLRDDML